MCPHTVSLYSVAAGINRKKNRINHKILNKQFETIGLFKKNEDKSDLDC